MLHACMPHILQRYSSNTSSATTPAARIASRGRCRSRQFSSSILASEFQKGLSFSRERSGTKYRGPCDFYFPRRSLCLRRHFCSPLGKKTNAIRVTGGIASCRFCCDHHRRLADHFYNLAATNLRIISRLSREAAHV